MPLGHQCARSLECTLLALALLDGGVCLGLAQGEGPLHLVKNINRTEVDGDDTGSTPQDLVALGEVLLFSADDGIHGRELWRSDGSEAGTFLVADIRQGATGAAPNQLVTLGDTVFFVADDGIHGFELWRSDGTATGTTRVADLPTTATGTVFDLFSVGDRLFFNITGRCPCGWETDGTAEGTRRLEQLVYFNPPAVTMGDTVFVAGSGKLWQMTPAGVDAPWRLAAEEKVYGLFALQGRLFGRGEERQLWRRDLGLLLPPEDEPWRELTQVLIAGDRVLFYDEWERGLWALAPSADTTQLIQYVAEPDYDRNDRP